MKYDYTVFFDLPFLNCTFKQAINLLTSILLTSRYDCRVVITPNVDHIVRINKDSDLFTEYKRADIFFADGFPLILASKLLLRPLKERITGADIFPALCNVAALYNLKVFILGGNTTDMDIELRLEKQFPGAIFRVYSPSMDFQFDGSEGIEATNIINLWSPDLVFCCLGMPKQELWALKYKDILRTKLVLCVGAALDFSIGKAIRAPLFIQKIGFEWLWRLCSNPKRLWKRYLFGSYYFVFLTIKELIKLRRVL